MLLQELLGSTHTRIRQLKDIMSGKYSEALQTSCTWASGPFLLTWHGDLQLLLETVDLDANCGIVARKKNRELSKSSKSLLRYLVLITSTCLMRCVDHSDQTVGSATQLSLCYQTELPRAQHDLLVTS